MKNKSLYKYCLLLLLLLSKFWLYGQSTNQVINIANNEFQLFSSNFISSSFGEPFTLTNSTSNNILTGGFLQPIGVYFLGSKPDVTDCVKIKVWPIPAKKYVNLYLSKVKGCKNQNINLHIFNLLGQLILSQNNLEGSNLINVSSFASGIYFFELYEAKTLLFTKKVLVTN